MRSPASHGPNAELKMLQRILQRSVASREVIGGVSKRSFDVVGAITLLFLLSPILLLIAAAIKFTDGGNIIYKHPRVGLGRKPFGCLKFRTMIPEADEILRRHLQENPDAVEEWRLTRKLKNDPRVSALGNVLRKTSLDELPQLVNILRGEMSFVGPRPVISDELRLFGDSAAYYLRARPGLTGLWQISGRNDVSYEIRVHLDRRYVEKWTFSQDLIILIKTIPAVILARGSY